MKKKILLAFMLFTMSISVVACGDKSESIDEKETRQEREKDNDDSDGKSALLGKLSELTGNDVPLAATVSDEDVAVAVTDETATVEIMTEETVATADEMVAEESDVFNLNIDNPVVYSENGVTLTFDGFEKDTSYENVNNIKIKVENNNPDNKKVYVEIHHVTINNMLSDEFVCYCEQENGEEFVQAGESTMINVRHSMHLNSDDEYSMFYELQQDRLEVPDNKIQTIGIYYNIRIGTDSEREERAAILNTSDYKEGYLESFYGDYVTSIEVPTAMHYYMYNYYECAEPEAECNINMDGKGIIEIYKKKTESGTVFVLKNTDEEFINYNHSVMRVNGEDIRELNEAADNTFINMIMGNGGIAVFEFSASADEIRSAYEISNDVPLTLSLTIVDHNQQEHEVTLMTIE